MTTDGWGIDDGWVGTDGRWHAASTSAVVAIGDAMGRDERPRPPGRDVLVCRPDEPRDLPGPCHLALETGEDLGELSSLPPGLPLGLHWLTPLDGGDATTLLVSPGRCHLPPDLRAWGATMQVPTTRSRAGWGIGDLADVRTIARWLDGLGGRALGLSPLHSPTPLTPVQSSPYYPSSRRWRSPLLLRVDEVPGAANHPEVPALAAEARAATAGPVLDRDAVWRCQRRALEIIWAARDASDGRLDRWRAEGGTALDGWARFCALAEVHGPSWSRWPGGLRHPDAPDVARSARALEDRVAFHSWLQLLLEDQLAAANMGDVRLVQDLAIGVDPGGADAWLLQDLLALGVSVGAPPDTFQPAGQDWGLPPFVPWRLRDVGYRPLAELLRASMVSGGGLRIDHVMGLSRLFWIPDGAAPEDGTYVRFAGRELLEVVAMESARAGAVVVGEDLGTVEKSFREELRSTDVLSTRLVWFEDGPPERYPHRALAMVTTHDLPTIAGLWTGADERELESLGRPTPEHERDVLPGRLRSLVGLDAGAPPGEVVDAVHRRLAAAPSMLAMATLEDLCEVTTRPNVPGTVAPARDNWSMALPMPTEDLIVDAAVDRHLRALADGRGD